MSRSKVRALLWNWNRINDESQSHLRYARSSQYVRRAIASLFGEVDTGRMMLVFQLPSRRRANQWSGCKAWALFSMLVLFVQIAAVFMHVSNPRKANLSLSFGCSKHIIRGLVKDESGGGVLPNGDLVLHHHMVSLLFHLSASSA